jgi:hypothetical protein
MYNYLESFKAARDVVLPCLYLPAGTELPKTNTIPRKSIASAESKKLARKRLRVSALTLPGVESAVSKACKFLRVARSSVHAFVSPEAGRNAYCMIQNDEPVIVFGSALIEFMDENELACIAGHEIGHFLLPEAHLLSDPATKMGRIHSRAAEITMDRIGLIACGDFRSACNAEMKLMCGLKEPHLRLDVSAFINEARENFDGTFFNEEDSSHPPAQLRLRAIVEFANSDVCLKSWGLEGGKPIAEVNKSIASQLNEQIDRHVISSMTKDLKMAKIWLYCLCKSKGITIEIKFLNQFKTAEIKETDIEKAWNSLMAFEKTQISYHAKQRFNNSVENAFKESPELTKQFLIFINTESKLLEVVDLSS